MWLLGAPHLVRIGIGVEAPAPRLVSPAPPSAIADDIRRRSACDDPDVGRLCQRGEPRRPTVVLKCRFGDQRDAAPDQEVDHVEERRGGFEVRRIAPLRRERPGRGAADEAFLYLIAANGRTVKRLRQGVRERRLAGCGRTADDQQGWRHGRHRKRNDARWPRFRP